MARLTAVRFAIDSPEYKSGCLSGVLAVDPNQTELRNSLLSGSPLGTALDACYAELPPPGHALEHMRSSIR